MSDVIDFVKTFDKECSYSIDNEEGSAGSDDENEGLFIICIVVRWQVHVKQT